MMRYLFRLNVLEGHGAQGRCPIGYRVGGKTGTAEKVINGRYSKNHRLTSFVGAFPMDEPRYVVLVMLDEPQPTPETYRLCDLGLERGADGRARSSRASRRLLGVEPISPPEERKKLEKQAEAGARRPGAD